MKISLSQFIAYSAKTTTAAKMNQISKIKHEDYSFPGDYWLQFRNKLHKALQNEITFQQLEEFATTVDERRNKRKNYMASASKLRTFFSHKTFKYETAPKATWISDDKSLNISASPEFILKMDNKVYLIKVFYRIKKNDEKLTKRNVAPTLLLMDQASYSYRPQSSTPAILNLQTNQLITLDDISDNTKNSAERTLIGDITVFQSLWDIV